MTDNKRVIRGEYIAVTGNTVLIAGTLGAVTQKVRHKFKGDKYSGVIVRYFRAYAGTTPVLAKTEQYRPETHHVTGWYTHGPMDGPRAEAALVEAVKYLTPAGYFRTEDEAAATRRQRRLPLGQK